MSNSDYFAYPRVYLIAETMTHDAEIRRALSDLGVEDWHTDAEDDAALLTEFAGKSCYMSFDKSLNDNLTRVGGRDNRTYIQEGIVKNKHGSVLEHSSVTFFISDVSRVVTHELIRHRAGTAMSQTSGRYVRTTELRMFLPSDIASDPDAVGVFKRAIDQMRANVADLAKTTGIDKASFAVKKKLTSAFRRLIGNGQSNHIVFTANHRAWRHMIEMRTDPHAEEEIRIVFAQISRVLRERYPAIYADAIITEVDGIEVTTFQHSKV